MADDMLFDRDTLAGFTDVDYTIYHAVLQAGASLGLMRVRDLARDAGVAPSSVVRFAKRCGCSGYAEFQRRFTAGLRSGGAPVAEDRLDVVARFCEDGRAEAFQAQLDEAFVLLRWSRLTVFTGVGISAHLASLGARLFCNAGWFSVCVGDPFVPVFDPPGEEATVVALSFSGTTHQTLQTASSLVSGSARLVAVTNAPESPLARMADVAITYHVPDLPMPEYVNDQSLARHLNQGTQIPVLYVLEELSSRLYADRSGIAADSRESE